MKKILAIILITTMIISGALSLVACNDNNVNQKYTVGVCQLVQHDSLDQATQGFIDALVAELGEENVEIDVQNAAGDTNVCNTIITSFVSKNVDLIMANATPALQAAYNATTTIPILGTSITEYGVALGTTLTNDVVGGNVSGTSDLANLEDQAQMILEICPDVKVVGITYCSAEANSLYQVQKVTEYLENHGVTVNAYPFADSNDISAVVTAACAQCDALYSATKGNRLWGKNIIG